MDKEYWRLKKREQRARKREAEEAASGLPVSVLADAGERKLKDGEARESTTRNLARPETVAETDSRGGQKPSHIPEKEWVYACERAVRAKKYAKMFPEFVKLGEEKYQDPMWQWEHEVRGRYTNIVGGKLGAISESQLRER